MARPIYRRHRLPPALILTAQACTAALHDHIVTTTTTPPTPTEVPEMAAKKSAAKAKPPAKSQAAPVAAKLDALVEATAARLMAARPESSAPVDVPGVTQGGKPARAVGAPSVVAFGGLSLAAMKKLVAPLVKNALELGVKFGGQTVEDLAASQADLLDDFVPDAVYELIESIAHKMHGGEPHVVGATAPPTKPV